MRIAVVAPGYGSPGGAAVNVRETALWFHDHGDDVRVFSEPQGGPQVPPTEPDPRTAPVAVYRLPRGRGPIGAHLRVGLTEALLRVGADVIHAHNHRFPYVLQAARAARKGRVPFVASPHYSPPHHDDPRLKRGVLRLSDLGFGLATYGRAAALIAETELEARQLRPIAFSAPIHVIPPGLDVGEWADPRADRRDPRLPPEYFVYAGRIYKNKGLGFLVRALALLPPDYRRPLVLVGRDDGYRAELESLARQLGLTELIIFLGYVDRPTYRGVVRGAKVLVLPSEWESYGFTLLDAMAARTPTIASRTGTMPEVLDGGRTGLLVPYGDAPALAAALRSLDDDPAATRQRVARGAERVREYDWSKTAEAIREVFEGVVRR